MATEQRTDNLDPVSPPVENRALTAYNADDDFAHMRPSDIITPRLALQQFLSPGVPEGTYKAGDYLFADEKRVVIPFGQTGRFVPLFFWMNWIEWNPNRECKKDERIIDSSFDPQSKLCRRAELFEEVQTPKGPRFAVTEYFNWIVAVLPKKADGTVLNEYDDLAILSFSRSSAKRGKELLNRLYKIKDPDTRQRMPFFKHSFELKAEYRDEGADKKFMTHNVGAIFDTPAADWDGLAQVAIWLRENRNQIAQRELEKEKSEGSPVEATATQTQANTDAI